MKKNKEKKNSSTFSIKTVSWPWSICFNQNYHVIVNILSLYLSLPCTLPPSPNQRARMRDLLILGPQWASNTLPSCIIFEASYVLPSVIKSLASRQNSGSKLLKVQKMLWCHISSTLAPTTTYLLSSYEINPLSKFQI